jgi:hypothetical protein
MLAAGQIHDSTRPMAQSATATKTVITSQNFQKLLNVFSHPD